MRTYKILTLVCMIAVSAGVVRAQREKLSPDDLDLVEKTWPKAKKTSTGIRYIIEREGSGAPAASGDIVAVLYVGRLLQGGKQFDQNQNREHPFTFRLDRGFVIQGWDQIIQLMKVGEKRLVIIPPELAYGTHGQPPVIPRDATLVFDIEILSIKREILRVAPSGGTRPFQWAGGGGSWAARV